MNFYRLVRTEACCGSNKGDEFFNINFLYGTAGVFNQEVIQSGNLIGFVGKSFA